MLELYIMGQNLRIYTPVIAADSLHYLTAKAWFTGEEWDGYSRWAHFRKGEGTDAVVYDLLLDENDMITEDMALNLTTGEWTVYLSGNKDGARATTTPVILTVKESGLIDAPLHEMPLSVAEQIANVAATALSYAKAIKEAAEAGAFNGRDGTSFVIEGFYASEAALKAAVKNPRTGAAYGVGTAAPYEIYFWDAANDRWVNNGIIQGAKGETGTAGVTFRPIVDEDGNLSWTNDGGLENPATRNIQGPAGKDGATGPAGEDAYSKAQDAGYLGTKATFYAALAAMPYHNARHLPEGADPITVKTGNLEDYTVTQKKLAENAVSTVYTGSLGAGAWSGDEAPYTQAVTVNGVKATDEPIIDLVASESYATAAQEDEQWGQVYRAVTAANKITFYAKEKPTRNLTFKARCIRK